MLKINTNNNRVSRSQVLNDGELAIKDVFSDNQYKIRRAEPANNEGTGLYVENIEQPSDGQKVMVKASRNYAEKYHMQAEYLYSGWFTELDTNVEMYDYFVFIGYDDHQTKYFILSKDEMNNLIQRKNYDINHKYHFYFAITNNDEYLEYRDGGVRFSA